MASNNILISLEPKHAENILSGAKRFELRRRPLRVQPGTIVWMYSKLPEGAVVGHAVIAKVHSASPGTLWRRFGRHTGITRAEFFDYFSEADLAFALELQDSARLERPVPLDTLRRAEVGFQPPQFFKHLSPDAKVLRTIAGGGAAIQKASVG